MSLEQNTYSLDGKSSERLKQACQFQFKMLFLSRRLGKCGSEWIMVFQEYFGSMVLKSIAIENMHIILIQ